MDITLERILSLIPRNERGKYVHGAKKELCDAIGAPPNIISEWQNRNSKSYRNYLFEIAKFYGVSVEWLRGETDDPAPPQPVVEPSELEKKYGALDEHGKQVVDAVLDLEYRRCTAEPEKQAEIVELRTIRHYLVPAAAGYAAPIEGEDYEEIPLPKDAPEGADFAITIRGDSMEPYIKDGSMAFIQRGAQLQEFEVGIFFVDGDVFCKQWCVDYAGTLHLLSANPKREDANISIPRDAGRSCICFGKVLLREKLPMPVYR